MNQTFLIVTIVAYLTSMGFYIRFLYSGKEFTGRIATILML